MIPTPVLKNTQNTVSGGTGSQLVPDTGNWLLDGINSLADVASNVGQRAIGLYGDFIDASSTQKLEDSQKMAVPIQTTPAYSVSSPAQFLSDPARAKTLALYSLGAAAVVFAVVYAVKR